MRAATSFALIATFMSQIFFVSIASINAILVVEFGDHSNINVSLVYACIYIMWIVIFSVVYLTARSLYIRRIFPSIRVFGLFTIGLAAVFSVNQIFSADGNAALARFGLVLLIPLALEVANAAQDAGWYRCARARWERGCSAPRLGTKHPK